MRLEANVGEVKFYHEAGAVYKVEVLGVREELIGRITGHEYTLKVLDVIRESPMLTDDAITKIGEEFYHVESKRRWCTGRMVSFRTRLNNLIPRIL